MAVPTVVPTVAPTASALAEAAPATSAAPKAAAAASLHRSGEPTLAGPASKGRRLNTGEPLQAQSSKRAPAPEVAKPSEEDVFSARK
jgi:hypothetical protein